MYKTYLISTFLSESVDIPVYVLNGIPFSVRKMAHFQLDSHGECKKSLCHNPMFAQETLQHLHNNDLIISFLMLHHLE